MGTKSMFPDGTGLTLFTEFDYQNQNINWSGQGRAPAADNNDKRLRTGFYTLGAQYMFDRSWGIQAEVPVVHRYFEGTNGTGNIESSDWVSVGDIRLQGIYSGFFPDQSADINFGVKLPTGDFRHNSDFVDRDTQIGTGSTDALLGGYFRHYLIADGSIAWFAQADVDAPILTQVQYRPGIEFDEALGAYVNGISFRGVGITPIAQVIASERGHDSGAHSAHPVASGYERILLSPGIEFDFHPVMVYADVELPVYQHVAGDQLTSSFLVKVIVSYKF